MIISYRLRHFEPTAATIVHGVRSITETALGNMVLVLDDDTERDPIVLDGKSFVIVAVLTDCAQWSIAR